MQLPPRPNRPGRLAQENIPGLLAGIVKDGRLVHVTARPGRPRRGAAGHAGDAFRIASMTKSITALSILTLRDDGKLSLDAPLAHYVPSCAVAPRPRSRRTCATC